MNTHCFLSPIDDSAIASKTKGNGWGLQHSRPQSLTLGNFYHRRLVLPIGSAIEIGDRKLHQKMGTSSGSENNPLVAGVHSFAMIRSHEVVTGNLLMEHSDNEELIVGGNSGVTAGPAERPKRGGAPRLNRNAEKSGYYRRKAQLEAISFDRLHGNSSGAIQLRERK